MVSRLIELRRAAIERGRAIGPVEPTRLPDAIVRQIDAAKAVADAAGEALSPEWQALYHRREVERLSLAGMPVAEIAATLGLSTRHVVTLRAQLGVGRQR